MPWQPLSQMAVAVAICPFSASSPADLPLELGDDLYIIEQGGADNSWYRGYLVAPPSLLSGLTSTKGQNLEARVFTGIFPRCCVSIRESLSDAKLDEQAVMQRNNDADVETKKDLPGIPIDGLAAEKNGMPSTEDIESKDTSELSSSPSTPLLSLQSAETVLPRSVTRRLSHRSLVRTPSRHLSQSIPILPSARDPDSNSNDLSKASRPAAPVPMLKIGDETAFSNSEPLVDEISSCLREWHSKKLHELLLARQYRALESLHKHAVQLDIARRQLQHGLLTKYESAMLREQIVWDLVRGNKLLGEDIIVRDPNLNGRLLNGDDSPFELSKLQTCMSLLDKPMGTASAAMVSHQLLVNILDHDINELPDPTITMGLCSVTDDQPPRFFTEMQAFDLSSSETLATSLAKSKRKAYFSDVTARDLGLHGGAAPELFLVMNLYTNQTLLPSAHTDMADERPSIADRAESVSSVSTKSPSKAGRASLMWAQKQFGSVRSKSQQAHQTTTLSSAKGQPSPGSKTLSQSHSQPQVRATEDSKVGNVPPKVRRRVGFGLLDISQVMKQSNTEQIEDSITFWNPSAAVPEGHRSKSPGWLALVSDLGKLDGTSPAGTTALYTARVSIRAINRVTTGKLESSVPAILQNVPAIPRSDLLGSTVDSRSDIYLKVREIILPVKAILSHPELGTVSCPRDSHMQNLQLTLEIRKDTGERLESCIYPSANEKPVTAWRTCIVAKGLAWNDVIKLQIPKAEVSKTHLIMSIADAPNFPFALCWLPLWVDNAFLKDGAHTPLLYMYDKTTSANQQGRGAYLDYPWSAKTKEGNDREESVVGPVATLRLETSLCSSHFSQDRTVLDILNWQSQSQAQTLLALQHFVFVPEAEIAKLIIDIFDALFSLLAKNAGNEEYENAAFHALVVALGIVHDRRFHLADHVEQYAISSFDHPYASTPLLHTFARLFKSQDDPQVQKSARAAVKVARHIFRFILRARQQQETREDGIGASTFSSFQHDILDIFTSFGKVMQDPSAGSVGNKTLLIQHLPQCLPELKALLSEPEILDLAQDFLTACDGVQNKLVLYKLVFVLKLLDSDLFHEEKVRSRAIKLSNEVITPLWDVENASPHQARDQIRLCCSIVRAQVDRADIEWSLHFKFLTRAFLLLIRQPATRSQATLLFPSSYPFNALSTESREPYPDYDEAIIELGALMSHLMKTQSSLLAHSDHAESTEMVSSLLSIAQHLFLGKAFPSSWLSLYVYHHRTALRILERAFEALTDPALLPSPEDAVDFDTELWEMYLRSLLMLLRSPALALETFAEQKRRAVWKIAGDIRELGAQLLAKTWNALGWDTDEDDREHYGLVRLGGYQVQYVPALVPPVVELCLSVHESLRKVAIDVLQSMIISEWCLNEDLSIIQAEMIDCLDTFFETGTERDSVVRKTFISELLGAFEILSRNPGDSLWQAVQEMISTIDEMLGLLIAVHARDDDEPLRVIHTLELMDFLKDMRREDMFIRYVHQLAKTQDVLGNRAQAGLALKLHADQYAWDSVIVRDLTEPAYPAQTSFERKEKLYLEMIQAFEDSAAWDCALTAYQELAEQYEHTLYDFTKLGKALRAMASIHDSIAMEKWQLARYFSVTYRGLGFPESLRDRQFIYEGDPSERQNTFLDRLRQLHPLARLIGTDNAKDIEGQYLDVQPVSIFRDFDAPIYIQAKIAPSTREFLATRKPCKFAVTSARHSPDSELHDQWIEKTIFTTQDKFPTLSRRSEVVEIQTMKLTPLQTALERTTRKNAELAAMERRAAEGDDGIIPSMTETLSSCMSESSPISVAQYRQLLPCDIRSRSAYEHRAEHEDEDVADDDEHDAASLVDSARSDAGGSETNRHGRQTHADGVEKRPKILPVHMALRNAILDHVTTVKRCFAHYSKPAYLSTQATLSERLHAVFGPELEVLQPSPLAALAEKPQVSVRSPSNRSSIAQSAHVQPDSSHNNVDQATLGTRSKRASLIVPDLTGRSASWKNGSKKFEFVKRSTPVATPRASRNGSVSAPSIQSASSSTHKAQTFRQSALPAPLFSRSAQAKTRSKAKTNDNDNDNINVNENYDENSTMSSNGLKAGHTKTPSSESASTITNSQGMVKGNERTSAPNTPLSPGRMKKRLSLLSLKRMGTRNEKVRMDGLAQVGEE